VDQEYGSLSGVDAPYKEESPQKAASVLNPLCSVHTAILIAFTLFWIPGLLIYLFGGIWKVALYGVILLGALTLLGYIVGRPRRITCP
jgi:hypothetical protein